MFLFLKYVTTENQYMCASVSILAHTWMHMHWGASGELGNVKWLQVLFLINYMFLFQVYSDSVPL